MKCWRRSVDNATQHSNATVNGCTIVIQGPKTAQEISFLQVFGRDLHAAHETCQRYRSHGEIRDMERAWAIYNAVSFHTHGPMNTAETPFVGLPKNQAAAFHSECPRPAIHFPHTTQSSTSRTCRSRSGVDQS
jgi:hypothetical protein